MIHKIKAEINKVYFINKYTLVHILKGTGNIQVDFKNYDDWGDKAIFLEKGQYIKFISDDFVVRFIDFPDEILYRSKEVRVLFKHLISLGYINFNECKDCQSFLTSSVFNENISNLIDVSTKQWFWQNPFQAKKDEYQVIFDVKDVIDKEYANNINTTALIHHLSSINNNVQHLVKDKLGITINNSGTINDLPKTKRKLFSPTKVFKKLYTTKVIKILDILIVFLKMMLGKRLNNLEIRLIMKIETPFLKTWLNLFNHFIKKNMRLGFMLIK